MKKIISSVIAVGALLGVGYFFLTPTPALPTLPSPVPEVNSAAIKIIAFGDSLTAGYGLVLSETYPALLEKKLKDRGYDVDVINSGVSGETTSGNTVRAEFIRAQNADLVILGIGGNDALRFIPVPETTLHMERTLTTLLSGENPPEVFLLSMQAPSNAGTEYKAAFDALYPELALQFGIERIPFIVEEVSRNPALLQADGIHPTKEGYAVLIDAYILPRVESFLKKHTTP